MYSKEFDAILDEIQAIILSLLTKLGPFAVALMPALFTAYAIFHTFKSDAGNALAYAFAIVVGLAMETVGIVATHTSVDLYNGWQSGAIKPVKFWLMVLLVPFYVLAVAGVVFFSGDAFTPLIKSLGIASPFLTCVVYVAVALARDLSKIERSEEQTSKQGLQIELENRRHKQALELKQMDLEQARELKRIDANARVQIEQSKADAEIARAEAQAKAEPAEPAFVPAQSQHNFICEDCGRNGFGTIQALNAHQRFCTKKNGHEKQ